MGRGGKHRLRVQRVILISDEVYRRRRKIKFNILRRTTINLSKMMIVLRRMDSSLTRMGMLSSAHLPSSLKRFEHIF